jgi:hypothetical protein
LPSQTRKTSDFDRSQGDLTYRQLVRLAAAVYGVNFALPLGFCILNGYWIALCAGVGCVLLVGLAFGYLHSQNETVNYAAKQTNLQKYS